MASGSEVGLIVEAGTRLAQDWDQCTPGFIPLLGVIQSPGTGLSRLGLASKGP